MASFRCQKCGKQAHVHLVLSLLRRTKSYICGVCGTWHVQPEPPDRCIICGVPSPAEQDFPRKFVCQECVQVMMDSMTKVQKGGVYWTCSGCGAEGVFEAGSELAQHFREKHLTFPPEPIGIQIPECPKCLKVAERGTLTQKAIGC